ncbi:MAG: Holliday junction branch migration protein RuvA [candidate division KSB1 bacterium]|nr:Holliday junction branch migration protein RuvA [candidate division KSB1 bacterium]
MISFLKGKLVEKSPTRIVVEVNGVGYDINIPLSTYQNLGPVGETVKVLTYLHVRDEVLQLYGFASFEERELFIKLISVSGIGPKIAQAILSGSTVEDFKRSIREENLSVLTSIPGVGRKTALRLIVDLKEKLSGLESKDRKTYPEFEEQKVTLAQEAILALMSLGYNKVTAQNAVQGVLNSQAGELSLEELIKRALRLV